MPLPFSTQLILIWNAGATAVLLCGFTVSVIDGNILGVTASVSLAAPVAAALVRVVTRRSHLYKSSHLAVMAGLVMVSAAIGDAAMMQYGHRGHAVFGLILTACGVYGVPVRRTVPVYGAFCLWMVVTGVGEVADIGGKPTVASSITHGVAVTIIYGGVWLGVVGKMKEKDVEVEEERGTVKNILCLLAQFELEEAAVLMEDPSVSWEVKQACVVLRSKMKIVEPFLPEALLSPMASGCPGEIPKSPRNRVPPGQNTDRAAIVFTDIVGSTSIWEQTPDAMRRSLKKHDRIIRSRIQKYSGYEVKTIGDAFMVSFSNLLEGFEFSIDVQASLFNIQWPADLPSPLATRIGCFHGDVNLEFSPVTGRYDYLGGTVNKAARLESAGMPHCVSVTESVVSSLESNIEAGNILQTVDIFQLGEVCLRGLGEVRICLAAPRICGVTLEDVDRWRSRKRGCDENKNSKLSERGLNAKQCNTVRALNEVPSATVAAITISMRYSADALAHALDTTVHFLERCDATVATFQGMVMLASWNTFKKCITHLQHSFRFACMISSDDVDFTSSTGLACGRVDVGCLTGSSHAFLPILGTPVATAYNLSEAASTLNTPCLHAATPGSTCSAPLDPTLSSMVRPVDTWCLDGGYYFTVFEVKCTNPEPELVFLTSMVELEQSYALPWGWSPMYEKAFAEKDHAAIIENATGDGVLSHVVTMLQDGTHLRQHPMPWKYMRPATSLRRISSNHLSLPMASSDLMGIL